MIMQDDRTAEEKTTHIYLFGGTDRCLSGWGEAEGGKSYAFWACTAEHASTVKNWVASRSDIIRQRQVDGNYRPRGTKGHCHIYVVRKGHPALA